MRLKKYNELIQYNKLNKDTSDSVMPEKLVKIGWQLREHSTGTYKKTRKVI